MAYLRNDSTPLAIKAKVVNASDGSPITTGVTAYHVTGTTRAAGSGTLTHVANGLWTYTPTQSETNYEEFAIEFYHADAVGDGPVVQIFTSLRIADEVWDESRSSHTTSGTFGNVGEWTTNASGVWTNSTRTLTAATNIDTPIANAVWAATTRVLTAATNIDAAIADAVWDESRSGHTTTGTYGATGEWTATSADTWTYPTRTLTAGIPSAADIWSYTNRSLTDASVVADAVWDEQRSGHTTTGSFGAVSEWAGGATVADIWAYSSRSLTDVANIADAVWDEQRSQHTTTGTFGAVTEWAGGSGGATPAEIWSYTTRTLTAATNITDAIADAVWDELRSEHTTTGTFGAVSEWAGGSGGATAAEIADAVWDELRSEHVTTGTYGKVGEWAGGGLSTGARQIVITVQDESSAPLEGALVRVTKAAETYLQQTGSTGTTTFALDDGTWTVNVTMSGYLGNSTTHAVDSSETPLTVTLQEISFTPSAPGTVTGYATVLDEQGEPEGGVECACMLIELPDGTGTVGDTTEQIATSNPSGVIQFVGLIPGAKYSFRRGSRWRVIQIPTDATGTYELPNFWGKP